MRGQLIWERLQSQPYQTSRRVRLGAAAICVLAALITEDVLVVIAVLLVATICGGRGRPRPLHGTRRPGTWLAAENAVVAGGLAITGDVASPLLPYVLGLSFTAGLTLGLVPLMSTLIGLVLALVLAALASSAQVADPGAYVAASAQWLVLAVLVGLIGALSRRILRVSERPDQGQYVDAGRLLRNLRTVARALPGTLDPTSQAATMLDGLHQILEYDAAAVYVRLPNGALTTLAVRGQNIGEWDIHPRSAVVHDAWSSQLAQTQLGALPRRPGAQVPTGVQCAVIPLEVGLRTFGVVALEREGDRWTTEQIGAAASTIVGSVLPLETAMLFEEVRELAVTEERHRLARDIHDGIAQELVQLGYALDDAAHEVAGDPAGHGAVLAVRRDVTRLVGELRHSLFDLRSDVDPQAGLVAALTEHARKVGSQCGMTVHLSLDDQGGRLPLDTETHLLRIAQEAMTNARKHARATSLWITCRIAPPVASLTVEDDGVGIAGGLWAGGQGLDIMRERSARIQGQFAVEPRPGGGTIMRVSVGAAVPTGSVR